MLTDTCGRPRLAPEPNARQCPHFAAFLAGLPVSLPPPQSEARTASSWLTFFAWISVDKRAESLITHNALLLLCLSTANLEASSAYPRQAMRARGLPRSNSSLSDRMSRSEMADRSLLPLTASQVMMIEIANGIIESKNLDFFAACCSPTVGDARQVIRVRGAL